jgi:4-amino-4-deoxy-L-arabinose transferase-like glycosyltransferase
VLGVYAAVLSSSLGLTPLWLDEIQQFASKRHTTIGEVIRWVQLNAGASPLPYLAQRAFVGWFGYSAWAARFPAALCSVLCGAVFLAVCPRFLERRRWIALVLFLTLPVQFRYGLEARVYSQGLLFSLLTLWLFLRLNERYSTGLAVLYGIAIAAGLYSQPLTVFPVLAQIALVSRRALIPACAALLSYLPWYVAQHHAQAQYALIAPPTAFFSFRQINPRIVLHDITGGGYACAISLFGLAGWAIGRAPRQRLLLYTAAASLTGPIVMDIVFNYFFAERQLLFAIPALVLLAAQGVERAESRGIFAWALVSVFLIAASLKNFTQATVPRDDLSATADAISTLLPADACVAAVPREQIAFYLFFHPELQARVCRDGFPSREMIAATSVYATPSERQAFASSVAARFQPGETIRIGQSELTTYSLR